MRKYEILLVFHEMSPMDASSVVNQYVSIISENGGSIISREDWGNRQFAFAVTSRKKGKKYNRGYYCILVANANPKAISEMQDRFRISREVVMRFDVTRIADAGCDLRLRNEQKIAAVGGVE